MQLRKRIALLMVYGLYATRMRHFQSQSILPVVSAAEVAGTSILIVCCCLLFFRPFLLRHCHPLRQQVNKLICMPTQMNE